MRAVRALKIVGCRARFLAGCLALTATVGVAQTTHTDPLRLAQGFDINELLKGGDAPPDTPDPAKPGTPLRDRPFAPEADDVTAPLPAAKPAAPFGAEALVGQWISRGKACAGRVITFAATPDGFEGQSLWSDPIDGTTVMTRYEARGDRVLAGSPYPGDSTAYLTYAREYPAQVTRTAADGTVLDMIDDIPVTLIVAREADSGDLLLRFAEPVTICIYLRNDP